MNQTFLFVLVLVCAAVQILFLLNHHYLVRGILFTSFSGLLCLGIASTIGQYCGVILPITVPTLAVSGTLGVPGCLFLLLSKLICGV